jgi:predicted nucleotidyltransferase
MQEQFKDIVFEFVKEVSSIPKVHSIFMFGSVAKGEADAKSDIDFLIILDTQQDPIRLKERDEVSRIALDLEKKFNKDIQLVFSNTKFDGLDGHFVEEVLREGIILFGRVLIIQEEKLGFAPHILIYYKLTNLTKSDKMKIKRALYGYKTRRRHKGKLYTSQMDGLVEKLDGRRTGIASILLPYRNSRPVLDALENFGAKIDKTIIWLPEVKFENKFDLNTYASNVDLFTSIHEKNTKEKLLERIRLQTTNLPYDGMPENLRNIVLALLSKLSDEFDDETVRGRCLDVISILSGRRDDEVNLKIKELFLDKINSVYGVLSVEEKNDALNILQRIQKHDVNIVNQLMTDAVEKWTQEEFQYLLNSIDFEKLNEEELIRLKNRLWNWRADAERKREEEKVLRIDKILELYHFK